MFQSCLSAVLVLFSCVVIGNECTCIDTIRVDGTLVVPQTITQVYTAELGVRELTGNNDGVKVESYLASVGFNKGVAWCAAFVSWVMDKCGVTGAKSAWSPAWFPTDKTIWTRATGGRDPTAGDVFGIYFQSKNRIAHVGFIDEWHDAFAITVEGNTNTAGSREGDGVYRKRRSKRQIYKVSRWTH